MTEYYADRVGYFKQYYDMNKDKIKARSRLQHEKKRDDRLRKMIEYNAKKKKYISYQDLVRGKQPEVVEVKLKIIAPVIKKISGVIDFECI